RFINQISRKSGVRFLLPCAREDAYSRPSFAHLLKCVTNHEQPSCSIQTQCNPAIFAVAMLRVKLRKGVRIRNHRPGSPRRYFLAWPCGPMLKSWPAAHSETLSPCGFRQFRDRQLASFCLETLEFCAIAALYERRFFLESMKYRRS